MRRASRSFRMSLRGRRPLVVLDFKPNPKWSPPDMESEPLTGLRDACGSTRARGAWSTVDGNLFHAVNIGWGMVAHIYPGGTVSGTDECARRQRWIVEHIVEQLTRARADGEEREAAPGLRHVGLSADASDEVPAGGEDAAGYSAAGTLSGVGASRTGSRGSGRGAVEVGEDGEEEDGHDQKPSASWDASAATGRGWEQAPG